ncbi:hypothetical protein P154DRAFT_567466 [Amniculicola lignicola CBS 123094]|uniref:Uncharacterized protein n=1 Tax=Amniculicola lignicola CBS 123094 TaxID=1392246 RepID=A0A6A5VZE7_9PLEO|nr:hypothetical protein P154DRAFT_567466 [Amniculicola lignicola CBS 123094]
MQAHQPPPSYSATLAATKAVANHREPHVVLSSAAAATALRTHVQSPTLVGDTITKRMARRGSLSSQGSGTRPTNALRRHSSSGSMTERSFRAPSPSRHSPADVDRNAPPVPQLPAEVPGVGVVHRRASSVEPPPAYRVASPVGRGGGRGVSLDRATASPQPGLGKGRPRASGLSQVVEDESDSPRSVNFSRPMSAQGTSSPTQATALPKAASSGWFGGPVVNADARFRGQPPPRPKTADGLSAYQRQQVQQSVRNAAEKPVSTHRRELSHGMEGARLSTGGMRAKPRGSSVHSQPMRYAPAQPVDPKSPDAVYDPSTRTFVHKQDAMARFRERHENVEEHEQEYAAERMPAPRSQQRVSQPAPIPIEREHEPSPTPPPKRSQRVAEPATKHLGFQSAPEPSSLAAPPTATFARQSSEDFADADIRPSVDANTSRKMGTAAPARAVEEPVTSPKLAPNLDSPYPRVATPIDPDTLLGHGRGTTRSLERTASLSPPRNAHFAPVAVELPNGVKHQPPPRSYSPAKSAMKSSPAISRRSSSIDGRGIGSETSDNVSDAGVKRKKKVRVSFEEEPVIAGTSAYAEPDTPSTPSGLEASKWSTANRNHDFDGALAPRAALPSFGSIRDRNRRSGDDESPEKVTETISSSLSTSVNSIRDPLETSNDHVVGGILAQDFARKSQLTAPQEPLPPEVTTVEGTGYGSDSDQSDSAYDNHVPTYTREQVPEQPPQPSLPELEPKSLSNPVENKPSVSDVPLIAIQPASPGIPYEPPAAQEQPQVVEQKAPPQSHRTIIPGGWDEYLDAEEEDKEPAPAPTGVTPTPIQAQSQDEESSTDNDSIYSDAAEDFDDDDGGVFASIDAVVESPVDNRPSGLSYSKYANKQHEEPQSSISDEQHRDTTTEVSQPKAQDWNATQNHGGGLGDARKQKTHIQTPTERVASAKATVPTIQPPKPKQASAPAARRTQVEQPSKARQAPRTSQPQPAAQPRKSAMKQAAPAPVYNQPVAGSEPHMRKSMRAGGSGPPQMQDSSTHMRKSMRGNDPFVSSGGPQGRATMRQSMPPLDTRPPKGALQKRHIPATATPRARPQSASGPLKATPAPTYDSDSDASASSFQRERRRPSKGQDGKYAMRRSMRSGPAPTMRQAPPMRSVSPPVPVRSPTPSSLRKSMRPTSPTPAPEQSKSSKFSMRSLSPAGRFKMGRTTSKEAPPMPAKVAPPRMTDNFKGFGKGPAPTAPALSTSKTRFKSRFEDSSDEEEELPRRFQSRFVDSDEEDEKYELPPGLTPVRGIPRRAGEEDGDSTDLEEEASDAETAPRTDTKDIEKPMTNGKVTGEGASFSGGSLRSSKHAPSPLPTFEPGQKSKPKRSFFGLGKKKKTALERTPEPAQEPTISRPEMARSAPSDIPMPPSHRHRPLSAIQEDQIADQTTPQRAPKLQRRNTPQFGRSVSDSWPLPDSQPQNLDTNARPQSSDGLPGKRASSLRPTLTKRHSSAVSEVRMGMDPKTGKEVVVGRSGKKKKFQGLRRVFGLDS